MGPENAFSDLIHAEKYRTEGEDYRAFSSRLANAVKDDDQHFRHVLEMVREMRYLFAGRIQAAMGSPRRTTAFNCFVSGTIEDSMKGIMKRAAEAAQTMRMGGGIGYDFSTIRPKGDMISTVGSPSSGPVSFMSIFDAVCKTVSSAGGRRGAQMGVLRIDHPDIEEFIEAKQNIDNLTQFNISIGVTDEFMTAVEENTTFPLKWGGRIYSVVDAWMLWEKVMRSTWDWAEPGILFMDRINDQNNLWNSEDIAATNPCAEQPLPPFGACLLGSFNLVKYISKNFFGKYSFDYLKFIADIPDVVRAMDNVIDRTVYPLPEQEAEAKRKRRMGIGVTGVANAIEALGFPYGSEEFLEELEMILYHLTNTCYRASALLAKEKGPAPAFDLKEFQNSAMWALLEEDVQELIEEHGLRNTHLTSIAPTGTISLCADNVSSGIEPVFAVQATRTKRNPDGTTSVYAVNDYGYHVLGVDPKPSSKVTVSEHLAVLATAQRWIDSSVSKTINLSGDETWEEFKDVYMQAWNKNCKGCTTFNPKGKRMGILVAMDEDGKNPFFLYGFIDTVVTPIRSFFDRLFSRKEETAEEETGGACYYDPETGKKSCE